MWFYSQYSIIAWRHSPGDFNGSLFGEHKSFYFFLLLRLKWEKGNLQLVFNYAKKKKRRRRRKRKNRFICIFMSVFRNGWWFEMEKEGRKLLVGLWRLQGADYRRRLIYPTKSPTGAAAADRPASDRIFILNASQLTRSLMASSPA